MERMKVDKNKSTSAATFRKLKQQTAPDEISELQQNTLRQ